MCLEVGEHSGWVLFSDLSGPSPQKTVHFPSSRTIEIRGKGDLGTVFCPVPPFQSKKTSSESHMNSIKSWLCPAFY